MVIHRGPIPGPRLAPCPPPTSERATQALEPSTGPRTFVHWEPGCQDAWAEHLAAPEWVAAIQEALWLGEPDAKALELEQLLLAACAKLGLTHTARPHNPN